MIRSFYFAPSMERQQALASVPADFRAEKFGRRGVKSIEQDDALVGLQDR